MTEGAVPEEVDVITSQQKTSWLYPKGFWPEAKALFKLTWPTVSIMFLFSFVSFEQSVYHEYSYFIFLPVSVYPVSLHDSTHKSGILWSSWKK